MIGRTTIETGLTEGTEIIGLDHDRKKDISVIDLHEIGKETDATIATIQRKEGTIGPGLVKETDIATRTKRKDQDLMKKDVTETTRSLQNPTAIVESTRTAVTTTEEMTNDPHLHPNLKTEPSRPEKRIHSRHPMVK